MTTSDADCDHPTFQLSAILFQQLLRDKHRTGRNPLPSATRTIPSTEYQVLASGLPGLNVLRIRQKYRLCAAPVRIAKYSAVKEPVLRFRADHSRAQTPAIRLPVQGLTSGNFQVAEPCELASPWPCHFRISDGGDAPTFRLESPGPRP